MANTWKGKKQKPSPPEGIVPIADNRRARHDYEILDTFEAGIVLVGTEVKSLRERQVNFSDSYALLKDGEVFQPFDLVALENLMWLVAHVRRILKNLLFEVI